MGEESVRIGEDTRRIGAIGGLGMRFGGAIGGLGSIIGLLGVVGVGRVEAGEESPAGSPLEAPLKALVESSGVRAETPRVAEPGPSESPRGWQVTCPASQSLAVILALRNIKGLRAQFSLFFSGVFEWKSVAPCP